MSYATKVITRQELKQLNKREVAAGTNLRVNGYIIEVNGLDTKAYHQDAIFTPLNEYKMPRYIRDFVF